MPGDQGLASLASAKTFDEGWGGGIYILIRQMQKKLFWGCFHTMLDNVLHIYDFYHLM